VQGAASENKSYYQTGRLPTQKEGIVATMKILNEIIDCISDALFMFWVIFFAVIAAVLLGG